MAFPPPRRRVLRTPGAGRIREGLGFHLRRDRGQWQRLELELEKAVAKGFGKEMLPAMRAIGKFVRKRVQSGIRRGAPGGRPLRPNAPATVQRKKSARPLIDTGFLVNSIIQRTRRIGRARIRTTIGPPRGVAHPGRSGTSVRITGGAIAGRGVLAASGSRRRTVARIGAFHEFGFKHRGALMSQNLRRPFLRPVLRRLRPEIVLMFRRIFGREIAARLFFFGPGRLPITRGTFRA